MCFPLHNVFQNAGLIRLVKAIGQTRCKVFPRIVPLSTIDSDDFYLETPWSTLNISELLLMSSPWLSHEFITPEKMHSTSWCPLKARCPLHFDAFFRVCCITIGFLTLSIRCLDFLFAITGPELLNVMVSDFAMDADMERHFWLVFFGWHSDFYNYQATHP